MVSKSITIEIVIVIAIHLDQKTLQKGGNQYNTRFYEHLTSKCIVQYMEEQIKATSYYQQKEEKI